jgi:hypothetical protein
MNALNKIGTNNLLYRELSKKHLVYAFLLSNVEKIDGYIRCVYTVESVLELFNYIPYNEVKKALKELISEEVINIENDMIILGTYVGRTLKFFEGKRDSFDKELNILYSYADAFIKDSVGTARQSAIRKLKEDIIKLFEKNIDKWNTYDFATLYTLAYTVYFQDFHRPLQDKEIGQIKHLCKLYDNITLVKIIIHYVVNNENYGRSLPTIGLLLYNKDVIYQKVKGISLKNNIVRTTKVDEDFV